MMVRAAQAVALAVAVGALALIGGCAGRAEPVAPPTADADAPAPSVEPPPGQTPPSPPDSAAESAPATPSPLSILPPAPVGLSHTPTLIWDGVHRCVGALAAGGLVVCRGAPGTTFSAGGQGAQADAAGLAVLGVPREFSGELAVAVNPPGRGPSEVLRLSIAPRSYVVQSVRGLPPATVNPPTDPDFQARLARERALKAEGRASRAPIRNFLDGFIWPVQGGVQSGAWGNQRVLNGEPRPPHMGMDIAAPTGSPVRAPAGGKIVLAQDGMHFDGGLIFIDHGQGVLTQYLHLSRIDVAVGEWVNQGQVIGAVGATGRATGPHLCWRMRVREVEVDPGQAVIGLAAARAAFVASDRLDAGAPPRGWTP